MPQSTPPNPVDFNRLRETSEGDLEFEREVLGIYLEDTRGRLDRLQEVIMTHNDEEIRRLAHTIKGASATVGANDLRALAADLEEQATKAELNHNPTTLTDLEQAFAATTQSIHQHIATKA